MHTIMTVFAREYQSVMLTYASCITFIKNVKGICLIFIEMFGIDHDLEGIIVAYSI